MPWKERRSMQLREEFVLKAGDEGANVSALCKQYGISRKTGYKWLERYKLKGLAGLDELTRRPHRSPFKVSAELAVAIVAIRVKHKTWGARKIAAVLRREKRTGVPSERTIARVLVRAGLLQPVRRRKRSDSSAPSEKPEVSVKAPNDLWTVDFKGWWVALDGRCEPLTIRDAFSRFVLRIEVVRSTRYHDVRRVFEEVFRIFGVPKAIQTDNGAPFASVNSPHGLTRLSAWWESLGIDHIRSRPATPSDNGGHERMHRDIAAEVEHLASGDREAQQQALTRWRHVFNHERPHEALRMKTPADVYRRSDVAYSDAPGDISYPDKFASRIVSSSGWVRHRGRRFFTSAAIKRYSVGIEPTSEPFEYNVWFGRKMLGSINLADPVVKLTPAAA